ncbi:hypothetical protein SODALDRAFT_328550 [Sodiomyces alkalinus F11]|uniref:DUF7704 domain-containing protein n=1 Tax=Sodiomyces alkalinus (strain CBS 110278 / VKM F-3762 / F11) TaxID=1314773 RepID=A0A3N2PNU0_SODAK|nr:hypothetical protein SODALDRAFT_328550 [Sodiomyces alkalinus F11]ROT36187.1 hypothetical protein SODALDRAFT_328550 [Sodiomyces alkalinus F11]
MAGTNLPLAYRIFFLLIEPIATAVGAFYAHFRPDKYLHLTHAASAPSPTVPLGTEIALSQLGNLYLAFALSEALVLRCTADLRVWRAFLFVLLIADFGHLYTVRALGPSIYYDVSAWNAIDWGNIPYVYFAAAVRIAFLSGVGMRSKVQTTKKRA